MDRAEAGSVGVSLLGHAALFGLMALAVGRATSPPVPAPMEVSFVDEVGLTSATPQPVQSPPEQGMAPEAGPPEDAAATPDPPLPAMRPVAPQPTPSQAEAPPQRERPQAQPRQTNAPTDRTRRSLIGDDILKGLGRDPSPSRSQQAPATMTGEARASINAAIARALRPCQRQTLPAPQAATILVHVSVALNPDGSLASARVARVVNDNPSLEIYEERMQDLALAVVRSCTPIRDLPPQYYDVPRGWRQFNYIFDPRA